MIDWTPVICLASVLLAPAAITLFILIVRKPDHVQSLPTPGRQGFPIYPIAGEGELRCETGRLALRSAPHSVDPYHPGQTFTEN